MTSAIKNYISIPTLAELRHSRAPYHLVDYPSSEPTYYGDDLLGIRGRHDGDHYRSGVTVTYVVQITDSHWTI